MSYDDMYREFMVKGGAFEPAHFTTYEDALNDYLHRVKFTRNGFNLEISLHGLKEHPTVLMNDWICVMWVVIP